MSKDAGSDPHPLHSKSVHHSYRTKQLVSTNVGNITGPVNSFFQASVHVLFFGGSITDV